jgi:hypothetical protein
MDAPTPPPLDYETPKPARTPGPARIVTATLSALLAFVATVFAMGACIGQGLEGITGWAEWLAIFAVWAIPLGVAATVFRRIYGSRDEPAE